VVEEGVVFESIGITVDCAGEGLDELADFWASALGYQKLLPFILVDPANVNPRIVFQVVEEPKVAKNRWHLDLYVDHLDSLQLKVAEMTALGAQEIRRVDETVYGFTNTFTVMLDPQRNEFCVCAPHVPAEATK
jgi:hypothetical protein